QEVILGPFMKLDLNGNPFAILGGRMQDQADVNETTDTESSDASKEHHANGYIAIEGEFEIQNDTSGDNPTNKVFVTPILLAPSYLFYMELWPEGREADPNSTWQILAVCRSVSPSFMVQGSKPQTFTVSWISTGYYKRPYETNQDNGQ